MRPSASASSISLVKRPLPPSSASGRWVMRSPLVRMTTISTAPAVASESRATARQSRISQACASASGLPRVPSRKRGVAMPVLTARAWPREGRRLRSPDVDPPMLILGIETSCDETAAAVVSDAAPRLLGLGVPGGPAVEEAAKSGDAKRFPLPRPVKGRAGCGFSFAGLKTALAETVRDHGAPDAPARADLAASLQDAIADCLIDRTANALEIFRARHGATTLVVAGGVAANATLRARLRALAARAEFAFVAPPPALCTDNAAMIGWAGIERLQRGLVDGLDFAPRPRWPLDPDAAPARGAK